MKTFLYGTVFGVVLSTVGLNSVIKIFDHGVKIIKEVSQENAK